MAFLFFFCSFQLYLMSCFWIILLWVKSDMNINTLICLFFWLEVEKTIKAVFHVLEKLGNHTSILWLSWQKIYWWLQYAGDSLHKCYVNITPQKSYRCHMSWYKFCFLVEMYLILLLESNCVCVNYNDKVCNMFDLQ